MSKNYISDILFVWDTWIEGSKKILKVKMQYQNNSRHKPAALRQKASPIKKGGGFDDADLSIIHNNMTRHNLLFIKIVF